MEAPLGNYTFKRMEPLLKVTRVATAGHHAKTPYSFRRTESLLRRFETFLKGPLQSSCLILRIYSQGSLLFLISPQMSQGHDVVIALNLQTKHPGLLVECKCSRRASLHYGKVLCLAQLDVYWRSLNTSRHHCEVYWRYPIP